MTQDWLILPVGSDQLKDALWNGFIDIEGRRLRAVPCELIQEGKIRKAVLQLKPLAGSKIPQLARWWYSLRVARAVWVLLTAAWVFLIGWSEGWQFQPLEGFLAVSGAFSLHLAVNTMAEIQDTLRLLDFSRWFGPEQEFSAILEGWITPRKLWNIFWWLLVISIACGLPLLVKDAEALLPMAAMGLVACWGYAQPPLSLKYRGWGELVIYLACGPALVLALSWCFFRQWNFLIVAIGSCVGFWMAALCHVGNLPDEERDRENGISTLVTLFGFLRARWFLPVFYIIAWLSLFAALVYSNLNPIFLFGLTVFLVPQVLLTIRILKASGSASVWMAGVRRRAQWVHWTSLVAAVLWAWFSISFSGG